MTASRLAWYRERSERHSLSVRIVTDALRLGANEEWEPSERDDGWVYHHARLAAHFAFCADLLDQTGCQSLREMADRCARLESALLDERFRALMQHDTNGEEPASDRSDP